MTLASFLAQGRIEKLLYRNARTASSREEGVLGLSRAARGSEHAGDELAAQIPAVDSMERAAPVTLNGVGEAFPPKQVCSTTTTEHAFKIHFRFASQGPRCRSRREGRQSSFVCVPLRPGVVRVTAVSSEA